MDSRVYVDCFLNNVHQDQKQQQNKKKQKSRCYSQKTGPTKFGRQQSSRRWNESQGGSEESTPPTSSYRQSEDAWNRIFPRSFRRRMGWWHNRRNKTTVPPLACRQECSPGCISDKKMFVFNYLHIILVYNAGKRCQSVKGGRIFRFDLKKDPFWHVYFLF